MGKYPKRIEATAWRIIDNEAVIVSPLDSEVTILNEVGSLIWKLMDGFRDTEQLVKDLCQEYEVSVEEARKDIEEFIEDLSNKRLLTIS